jgi:hypothetical protein
MFGAQIEIEVYGVVIFKLFGIVFRNGIYCTVPHIIPIALLNLIIFNVKGKFYLGWRIPGKKSQVDDSKPCLHVAA